VNLTSNAAFRVGPWRIDPALDEISRGGTTVKLEPRNMRVLVCLAERAGEVVSVNELLDTVWKDLVVTQYSVYQAVAALRRALGDDPKFPTYIASVRRRGYRLVAPIRVDAKTPYPRQPPTEPPAEAELHEQQSPAENNLQRVLPDTYGGQITTRRIGLRNASTAIALLLLASRVWWFFLRPQRELHAATPAAYAPSTTGRNDTTSAVFAPPDHSVAVLPFINLSGDPTQEYFCDGMTEELINALAQISALKVTARTSSFLFKGKDADIGTIARKLNVAAVLEGSVRRSGNRVRITAQLVNAISGFHIWSRDYDGDLSNVLALQTDIAAAVARELQAKLPYLRGIKAYSSNPDGAKELQIAIAAYAEAIRLDPKCALAFAGRSVAVTGYAMEYATGAAIRQSFDAAQTDARQVLALAAALAEGDMDLAPLLDTGFFEFTRASKAHERALALAPGYAESK